MPLDKRFLDSLRARLPMRLNDIVLPEPARILILAPHPDDFDAIAVSLRFLQQLGHALHLAVLTSGSGGVEDGWNGAVEVDAKAKLREAEQRESCAFFGLPAQRLSFLRLWEHADDSSDKEDDERLRQHILSIRPHCVFLPHGNDSNRTHRRTFETFHAIATGEALDILAFLNLDAKTVSMRSDVFMHFGAAEAEWKARLLRMHRSQHERNLKTRGYGFDERVLRLNREAAPTGTDENGYAEVFELKGYGQLA